MSSLTDAELSLHVDVDASDYIAPARSQKKQRDDNSYLTFEPVPDHLPAKDIIAIAKVCFQFVFCQDIGHCISLLDVSSWVTCYGVDLCGISTAAHKTHSEDTVTITPIL